jgi:hypothetical protein
VGEGVGEGGVDALGGVPPAEQRPVKRRLVKRRHNVIESGIFGAGLGVGGGKGGGAGSRISGGGATTWEGPPSDQPPKTPQELEDIASAVENNFLFSHLDAGVRGLLFEAMTRWGCTSRIQFTRSLKAAWFQPLNL